MTDSQISKVLNIQQVDEYSKLGGVEYMFHEALNENLLEKVLQKFPLAEKVTQYVNNNVLSVSSVPDDWEDRLVIELNKLIAVLPSGRFEPLTTISQGAVDYDTDSMFTLRGEMGKLIRSKFTPSVSSHERAFLNDFFYGVDFTHWTKWAILLNYTDLAINLETALRLRRNNIDFCIDGNTIYYEK